MKASVIICTYNRAAMLDSALQSLLRVTTPAELTWEIVSVDNNSTDETWDTLTRWQRVSPVPLVVLRELRQGKSFALNRAIAAAQGEILVFTDDDVEFDPAWLERVVAPFAEPDVVGVGGRIEAVWAGPVPSWWSGTGPSELPGAIVRFELGADAKDITSPPYGANMAFRRGVFERLGGFREDLGPAAGTLLRGEDLDLGQRVLDTGGRIVYAPLALVYHPVEPARARKSYFRQWCFDLGRSAARGDSLPSSARRFFGVPRYLFRDLLSAAWRAILRVGSGEFFFWELQVIIQAGKVYEFWGSRDEIPSRNKGQIPASGEVGLK